MRKFGKESAAPAEKGADRESGNGWLRSHWCVLALGIIVIVAFLLRFVFSYGVSADGDYALSGGTSAQYHLHVIESILAGTWSMTDMSVNYPIGGSLYIPPLMDFLGAGVASIFQGSMGSTEAASFALAVLNPIFGALACVPVYLIGREMFDKKIGVVAALVFAFLALPISTSVFSSGTEYALAAFLVAFAAYFAIKMVKVADSENPTRKAILLNGLLTGVFLMLSALTWNGFRVAVVVLIVAMVVQAVASRIRGKSFTDITLGYCAAILVGTLVPAAYYIPAGLWDAVYSGALLIAVVSVVLTLAFLATRAKPWVVTIPALVVVFIAIAAVLFFAAPDLFNDFIWGNSAYTGTMEGLVNDRVSMSNVAAYYGWLTMWLPICLAIYGTYVYLRRDHSATQCFTVVWLFVMFFATWTSYQNAAVVGSVFAVGSAAVVVKVFREAKIRDWAANVKAAGFPGCFRKLIKPLPFISVIVVACLVVVPNFSFAVDAGQPTNTEGDHFYTGNTNFTIKTGDSYPLGQIWDQYEDQPKDGALVSWIDYSYDAVAQGGFDSVTDSLGGGAAASAHAFMSDGSAGAVAAMMLRIMMSDSGVDYSGCFSGHADVYNAVRGYIQDPASAHAEINANPAVYGKVRADLTDENAVYLAGLNTVLSGMNEVEIMSAYDQVCDASGDKIGYILADGTMLPLQYGDGDNFSTMAYFAGYSVDGYGAASQFFTYNTYSGITQYNSAIYDTMLWKALIGPSHTEAGFTSSYNYLVALSCSDGTTKAIPGYGLTGFIVENWMVMYNPDDEATLQSEGWEYMDGLKAIEKQETDGGMINYLVGIAMLKYTGTPGNASTITGQVAEASGAAIDGAHVSVYQYSEVYGQYVLFSETTTRGGSYTAVVPSGDYRVDVSIGDVVVGSFSNGASVPTVSVQDSVLTGQVEVNGEVYDKEKMMLTLTGGAESEPKNCEITDGTITIDKILPGTYDYVLYGQDGTSLGTGKVTVMPGNTTGLKIAPKTYTITATVNNTFGQPVDGTSYNDAPYVVATNIATGAQFKTEVGEDGKAVITVMPGRYTMSLGNGLVSVYSTEQNATSSNRSVTLTSYEANTYQVNVPADVVLTAYAGEFSTTSFAANGNVYIDVPKSIATDRMLLSVYGISGNQVYYGIINENGIDLSSGSYVKVSGTLKDGDKGMSGTVNFIGSNGFKVTVSTGEDGTYSALLPTGSYTIYAYNSGSRVAIAQTNVTTGSTGVDINTVDGRRVSETLRYDPATTSSSVNLPYVLAIAKFTYEGTEYTMYSMTNNSGQARFYLPDNVAATVYFNNVDGDLDNDAFECTELTHEFSSGTSDSSNTITIYYVGHNEDDKNLVKQVNYTAPYDMKLTFHEDDDNPITMKAGDSKLLSPGQYEIVVEGSTGHYFDGTATLYPGTGEFVGFDAKEVVTVNITKNEADAVTIQTEGSYHSFTGGYYFETGYEYFLTSVNNTDSEHHKVRYGYLDLTEGAQGATIDMTATADRMEVTGFVGISADGTITVEYNGIKHEFDVDKGAYTLVLPSDVSTVQATAEVSVTVDDVESRFSATQTFSGMADGSIRNLAVKDSAAPSEPSEDEEEPAFEVTVDDGTIFAGGMADVVFTIKNNTDSDMTYIVSAGSAWSLFEDLSVTIPANGSGTFHAQGYYDDSRVAPGLENVDLIVSDINGTDTVTTAIDKNAAPHQGSEGMDVLRPGDEGAANDKVSASQYMYAVTFVNKDVYAKQASISLTAPAGWFVTIMDADGNRVMDAGQSFTVYGLQTVTYYVVLMPQSSEPDSKITAPSVTASVTYDGGNESLNMSPASVEVSTDSSTVSGGDAMDNRSGLPAGIWFLVALIILMIIAIFWLASKRGVMSRR